MGGALNGQLYYFSKKPSLYNKVLQADLFLKKQKLRSALENENGY